MKKISLTLVLAITLSMASSLFASALIIDETVTENYLTRGITHTNIKRFTEKGMYNINYMEADLTKEGISVKVLANEDTRKKSTLLSLCENEENVIGAVNADFFTTYSSSAAAEGLMIRDGKLITTPSNDPSYATFIYDKDDVPYMDYFTYTLWVTSERTEQKGRAFFYNKNGSAEYLKVYDSNFGAKSPGSMDDGYEVLVVDGEVKEIYSNKEGIEIPKDGYVLHNSLRHSLFLMENFQVGDKVKLELEITPDISDIKEAAGGGTLLLKDGEIAKFTLKDALNPITAVGISKDKKKLIFLTVDGRSKISRGMTFKEAAEFLKELGCYDAMSFDGGGSTTMVGKLPGKELSNLNYQSSYRAVINGLSIVSDKHPQGDLFEMKLSLSQERAHINLPVEVSIETAYDKYGNDFYITRDNVKYSSDKKGHFKGNIYYPEEEGTHKITVTFGKIKAEIPLFVTGGAVRLKASKENLDVTDKEQKISFYTVDEEGYSAYISSDYLNFDFDKSEGVIKKDIFVLTNGKEGTLTASFEDISLEIPIGEKKEKKEISDKFFKSAKGEEGYTFGIFPVNNYGETLFTNYITGKRTIRANECDLSAFTSIPEGITAKTVKVTNYGREDEEHSLFLKLDNSKGSIIDTKGGQWEWLLNVFKKGVPQKNVFLTLPLDFEIYESGSMEAEILIKKLKENLPDKNIFIISYGEEFKYNVKDGIRYITVCQFPEFSYENAREIVSNLKYGLFTITDDDVFFEFKNIIQ